MGEKEQSVALLARSARGTQIGTKDSRKQAKGNIFYTHCQRTGHTIDQCFKLVLYLDWYKGLRDNLGKPRKPGPPPRLAANFVNTCMIQDSPLEDNDRTSDRTGYGQIDHSIVQALAQEMIRYTKGKQTVGSQEESFNAHTHFAGIVSPHSSISFAMPNNYSSS